MNYVYRASNASAYITGLPTRANSDNTELAARNINYSQRCSVAILVNTGKTNLYKICPYHHRIIVMIASSYLKPPRSL